jgi:glucuronosyltransferase
MHIKISLLLIALLCATTISSHRILGLFPHPGLSHFHFFQPVMKALAEAGHEVTVVSQFQNLEPIENYHDELLPGGGHGLLNFVDLKVRNFKRK